MKRINTENGQSLVIVAIAFFALVAVAALVIDGGILYLNRRNAQTAADAAAMAGAHEWCVNNGSFTDLQTIVNQYAITENGATAVELPHPTIDEFNADSNDYSVNVRTTVQTSSFFARILGYQNNTVGAEASANCFPPDTGVNVLPVAWTCQPPVGGSTGACSIHNIPWDVFNPDLLPRLKADPNLILDEDNVGDNVWERYTDGSGSKAAYILMDDNKFIPHDSCKPYLGDSTATGTINCDFNNDGILDVEGGADRGWLYLGLKQQGANGLKYITRYGYPDPLPLPQWFPNEGATDAVVFGYVDTYHRYLVSFVPVFNAICEQTKGSEDPKIKDKCPTVWVNGDQITDNGKTNYYRVVSFAPFVVTCVSANSPDKCPAKTFANIKASVKTIEGYFVSGYTAPGTIIDPGGFYMGLYIVSLIK